MNRDKLYKLGQTIEMNYNCRLEGIKRLNEYLFIGNKFYQLLFFFIIRYRRVLSIFSSILIANRVPGTFFPMWPFDICLFLLFDFTCWIFQNVLWLRCQLVNYWLQIHITVMLSKNIYIALELIDSMGDTGNRAEYYVKSSQATWRRLCCPAWKEIYLEMNTLKCFRIFQSSVFLQSNQGWHWVIQFEKARGMVL